MLYHILVIPLLALAFVGLGRADAPPAGRRAPRDDGGDHLAACASLGADPHRRLHRQHASTTSPGAGRRRPEQRLLAQRSRPGRGPGAGRSPTPTAGSRARRHAPGRRDRASSRPRRHDAAAPAARRHRPRHGRQPAAAAHPRSRVARLPRRRAATASSAASRIATDWSASPPVALWRRADRSRLVVVRRRRRSPLHAGAARRGRDRRLLQRQHRRAGVAAPRRGALLGVERRRRPARDADAARRPRLRARRDRHPERARRAHRRRRLVAQRGRRHRRASCRCGASRLAARRRRRRRSSPPSGVLAATISPPASRAGWARPRGEGYSSPQLVTIDGVRADPAREQRRRDQRRARPTARRSGQHAWKGYPIVQPALTARRRRAVQRTTTSGGLRPRSPSQPRHRRLDVDRALDVERAEAVLQRLRRPQGPRLRLRRHHPRRASISPTARASGRAAATATASSCCCPIRTCCWCSRRKASSRWCGATPDRFTELARVPGTRRQDLEPPGARRRRAARPQRRGDGRLPPAHVPGATLGRAPVH